MNCCVDQGLEKRHSWLDLVTYEQEYEVRLVIHGLILFQLSRNKVIYIYRYMYMIIDYERIGHWQNFIDIFAHKLRIAMLWCGLLPIGFILIPSGTGKVKSCTNASESTLTNMAE